MQTKVNRTKTTRENFFNVFNFLRIFIFFACCFRFVVPEEKNVRFPPPLKYIRHANGVDYY